MPFDRHIEEWWPHLTHRVHKAELGQGPAPRIWQLALLKAMHLDSRVLAVAPETVSEMSTHATQVSAAGDVRMKRGACLMKRLN
jgi:hypothetical protein